MIKKLIIVFSISILCIKAGTSQASAFYIPTDDVTYFSGSGYAINDVSPLTSYNYGSYYAVPYLKYDISDLSGKTIQNITLKMHIQPGKEMDNPTLNMYLVDSGTWNEGGYYHIQGTVNVDLSSYYAFTSINRPEILKDNFLASGKINGDWYEWQIQFNKLSDKAKADFNDGIISFAIEQQGNNYINFDPKENEGKVTEVVYQDTLNKQNEFEKVNALPNLYAPQLYVETISPTPEPSALILGTLSFLGILISKKRKEEVR